MSGMSELPSPGRWWRAWPRDRESRGLVFGSMLLALGGVALALACTRQGVGIGGDGIGYVAAARNLARGEGLSWIGPGHDVRPMVIFGNGTQSRDFTYVTDTAKGIIMAGFADNTVGRTINLGSGREIVINDLARKVASIISQKEAQVTHDNPRPGDVYRLCADVTMARQLLNFEPTVSLDEGLSKLRDWYLSLGQPPEVLLEQETVRNWELKLVKIDV